MDQLLFLLTQREKENAFYPSSPETIKNLDSDKDSPPRSSRSDTDLQLRRPVTQSRSILGGKLDASFNGTTGSSSNHPGSRHTITAPGNRHDQPASKGLTPKFRSSYDSSSSNPRKASSKRNVTNNGKYISPYILQASKRAEDRAAKSKQKHSIKPTDNIIRRSNEWNNDTKTPDLFDPKLKKQEIFKPEPRRQVNLTPSRPSSKSTKREDNNYHSIEGGRKGSTTIRTGSDVPLNRPRDATALGQRDQRSSPANETAFQLNQPLSPSRDSHDLRDTGLLPRYEENDKEEDCYVEVKSRSTSPFDERLVELLMVDQTVAKDNYLYEEMPMKPYQNPYLTAPSIKENRHTNGAGAVPNHETIYQPSVDMMNSMAKLMDAVGNMVTKAAETVNSTKLSQRRYKSYRAVTETIKSSHSDSSGNATKDDIEKTLREKYMASDSPMRTINEMQDVSLHEMNAFERRGRDSAAISKRRVPSKRVDSLSPENHPHSQSHTRKEAISFTDKEYEDIVLQRDMKSSNRKTLTKSAMLDLVLTKIQAMESCEQDIRNLLAKSPSNRQTEHKTQDSHHDHGQVEYSSTYQYKEEVRIDDACKISQRKQSSPNSPDTLSKHDLLSYASKDASSLSNSSIHRAPSILSTHDTALVSAYADAEIDKATKVTKELSQSHSKTSRQENSLRSLTDGQSRSYYSSDHVQIDQQTMTINPSTSDLTDFSDGGLNSDLLVILDSKRGEYSRRRDEKAHKEYMKQEYARKSLYTMPVLEPLPYDVNEEFKQYQKKLARVHEMNNIPFKSKGLTVADVVTRVADSVLYGLISDVEEEFDGFIDEYTDHFATKI